MSEHGQNENVFNAIRKQRMQVIDVEENKSGDRGYIWQGFYKTREYHVASIAVNYLYVYVENTLLV